MDERPGEEFREFMHGRWPSMVRLAYGLTGDQGHAEDVVQAAFARAYAPWPRVRRSGNPNGLLVLGEQHTTARPGLGRVPAAGALLGLAADIKINYVLFGLGAAWALRRSFPALALAGAAALAVLLPSYAYFGTPAIRALLSRRNQSSADNFYRAFLPHGWHHDLGMIATVLVVAAILALRRLPPGAATVPRSGLPSPSAPRGCSSGPTSCPGTTR